MIKAVLDTNQFVSGIIMKKGASRQLLQAWRKSAYMLITSQEILEELYRVFQYPRIVKNYHLTEKDISSLFNLIQAEAVVLSTTPKIDVIKEDPADNKILSCAIEAKADYIVSGDKHLKNIGEFKEIGIVSAREFLDILKL